MLIAVDLDDVLSQTNERVRQLHNNEYGTDMTLEDFKYYHYWRNRGWGGPKETFKKVHAMYARHAFDDTPPVEGAFETLSKLKMSHPSLSFVIITARGEPEREGSTRWVQKHFPNVFDELHFTGSFTHMDDKKKALEATTDANEGEDGEETENGPPPTAFAAKAHKPLKKSEVIHRLGASLLIDDSLENAFDVASSPLLRPTSAALSNHPNPPSLPPSLAVPAFPVLLFGDYAWNHRLSTSDKTDSWEEAREKGVSEREGWVEDSDLPEGVVRVAGWEEVARWIGREVERRGEKA